jgi:hypothetical protein
MTDRNGSRIGYVTNKLPTLHQILTKPYTSGLDEEERTSVVDDGEDVARRWGLGQKLHQI